MGLGPLFGFDGERGRVELRILQRPAAWHPFKIEIENLSIETSAPDPYPTKTRRATTVRRPWEVLTALDV